MSDFQAGTNAQIARCGEQQVGRVAVRHLDTVRFAGGAGGEDDVAGVVAGNGRFRHKGFHKFLVIGKRFLNEFINGNEGAALRNRYLILQVGKG